MNRINKETLELIKSFEGKELKAYKDAVGVWTIGYGHTAMAGPPSPKAGMVITNQEAEDLLIKDLRTYENAVVKTVKVGLNDNQYGALVSLCYNIGPGNFSKSTLVRKLNAGDYEGAANQFAVWNKAKGNVLKGLTRRRAAEAGLFRKKAVEVPREPVHVVVDDPGIQDVFYPKEVVQSRTGLLKAFLDFLAKLFGKK